MGDKTNYIGNKSCSDNEQRPDFRKVKWNNDFVYVTYEDGDGDEDITCTLSQYNIINKTLNKKPKIKKMKVLDVIENVICLLKHYDYKAKYNILKLSYEILDNNNSRHKIEDFLVILQDCAIKHDFKITKEKLNDSLRNICKKNEYNPIVDYLESCHAYYLNDPDTKVFEKLCSTIESDSIYKEKYIGKFLLQMVYLACCQNDSTIAGQYMLVLQGKQGIGKTTWFQNLLPKQLIPEYFLGGRVLDLNNKDHILETISNWLVEMGEISSTFKKSDQESLKNFITAYKDKVRPPYARESIEQKRHTALCATTNDIEYLKDLTGTRRFLTINCKYINYNHNIDVSMLWGYMYTQYLKEKPYYLNESDMETLIFENEEFISKPDKILLIEDTWDLNPHIDIGEWKTAKEIFYALPEKQYLLNKYTISKELKKANVKYKYDRNKTYKFFVCKKNE